jgi:hypothetical protein
MDKVDMKLFLDWKYLNEDNVQQLEELNEPVVIKKLLRKFFHIHYDDKRKTDILIDFHFYNYAFCKERAFDARKISTYLAIMHEVFLHDCKSASPYSNVQKSFEYFEELMLKHAIERSPKGVKIFEYNDASEIFDFTANSYYRHFRLFKFIFSEKTRMVIQQVNPNSTEIPRYATAPSYEAPSQPPSRPPSSPEKMERKKGSPKTGRSSLASGAPSEVESTAPPKLNKGPAKDALLLPGLVGGFRMLTLKEKEDAKAAEEAAATAAAAAAAAAAAEATGGRASARGTARSSTADSPRKKGKK